MATAEFLFLFPSDQRVLIFQSLSTSTLNLRLPIITSSAKHHPFGNFAFNKLQITMPLMFLPPEIHFKIIDYLSLNVHDILALRRVNHYFRNLLNRSRASPILLYWETNFRPYLYEGPLPCYRCLNMKEGFQYPSRFSRHFCPPRHPRALSRRCNRCAREEFLAL